MMIWRMVYYSYSHYWVYWWRRFFHASLQVGGFHAFVAGRNIAYSSSWLLEICDSAIERNQASNDFITYWYEIAYGWVWKGIGKYTTLFDIWELWICWKIHKSYWFIFYFDLIKFNNVLYQNILFWFNND